MRLIFSSSNKDKIGEIKKILGDSYEIILKSDLDLENFDIDETGETLRENAYIKAKSLYDITHENVIADDTGLFVEALEGKPGVHSARFSGENATYDDNNEKMLKELINLEDMNDRRAYFMTTICLITKNGEVFYAEGKLDGYIAHEKRGENRFGYNPIFIVKGYNRTLAEMSDEERVTVNHRKKAIENLKTILKELEN